MVSFVCLYSHRLNHSEVVRNSSYYQCCSGFCIDLLLKFAEDIGFTYELVRVQDSKFGTFQNGKWNGLIAELINRKADVSLASLMINSARESVVDFSVPFMDSGIAILTGKRTGIISPTAFLGKSFLLFFSPFVFFGKHFLNRTIIADNVFLKLPIYLVPRARTVSSF